MNAKDKKNDKNGGKKPKPLLPPPAPPTIPPDTKHYYLHLLDKLDKKMLRYQKKCDELEVANGQFHAKFEQMATDKKEIVAFWKKQVEQKTDEIADLNDRHIGLQQTRDNEREAFKKQIQEQRTEYQEMKDQLTSENMILGGKLAALEEFKVQKEDLMAKFAMMEEELAQRDADHKEHLYTLEKKAVMDKDRLKKEMILRVNQVAAEFRKVSNKQMAETTKRTIRENVSINAQLAKMSDKTIELIQENGELKEKEKKMKQQVEMLEANEKELAKKNHSNLKIIRMMSDKCRNQEAMISEFEMREQEYQELEAEAEILRQQVASTREELQNLQRDNELTEEDVKSLQKQLEAEIGARQQMEKVMADAASSLKEALSSTAPDDDTLDEEAKIQNLLKRERMLENLLTLLNSAAALGIGPNPSDLGKQWEEPTPAGRFPGSSQGMMKGDLFSKGGMTKSGGLPHYVLGDLGLIPRPTQTITTSVEKMRHITHAAQLGSLRGVLQKSVATQTVSAPKALFYADQLSGKQHTAQQAILKEIHTRELTRPPGGPSPQPLPKKLIPAIN
ncbi:cilia- and flagella-associated protein 157 [Plakobranchus ocellatus]|uniref:Cilia- and flagella-associated protein 157 n=1 Tax=Plakobranchus ocellatus TaxID=259542 RepID=A0AAV4DX26_9GAST|nr:cilia- and flagella-associated protein 157 [Plakobranchus ocellatus]